MNESTVEALSCQELVELVTAYLEGALTPEEHSSFEHHLASCDGCGVYVHQLQTTIQLAGRLTPEAIPPDAARELLAAFRLWKQRES
jgi:anti-sigma factor RsiW